MISIGSNISDSPRSRSFPAGCQTALLIACLWLPVATFTPQTLASPRPPLVRSIAVDGARAFTPREILTWLTLKTSQMFSDSTLTRDCETIRSHYRNAGYLGTTVSVMQLRFGSDSSYVDVGIGIAEGRQTVISHISIHGETVFAEGDLLSTFDTRPGDPLDPGQLEQDIDGLISRYEKIGYPLAACRITAMGIRPGSVTDTMDVDLSVEEGKRVTLDEIRVRGNKETDPSVILRETRLSPGELYDPTKVEAIRQRLIRLNIFSAVDEPQLFLRGEKGGLLINVREGSTNTFDGVLGYIPSGPGGQGAYLTGLVSVTMRNIFGTGRKLGVQWQREDRYSQELGLRYVEPWVFSQPVNLGVDFNQRQQDTSYVRRVFDLRGELMVSDALSLFVVGGTESVIPSSDSTAVRVSRSSTRTIGAELLYDTRDEVYSPTQGARYHVDYHYGRKSISATPGIPNVGSSDVAVQRLGFDLEMFFRTFARQVVATGIHGRNIQGGRVEEGEMFRFGGATTVRGYRENQFIGTRLAWMNNEYRFLLGRRTFFFGFLDTGYYLRPADPILGKSGSEAFKYGYGIGIRLDTSLGNLGVSFALGQGDSFTNAKIHFGIINEF